MEPQKPPEQSSGQSGSETARQTICGKIAAFFKRIWEFIFGTDGESGTNNADEVPPSAPDDKKPDEKRTTRRRRTKPGTNSPDGVTKNDTPPPKFKPPKQEFRRSGEPLKLYNFLPYADDNVCWLNSLTQLLLADEDLCNAAVEAFRADGHTALADHFTTLYGSKNAYARVNSDLLFEALKDTQAEWAVERNKQNDPGEAFLALTRKGSSSFLLQSIIGDLIELVVNNEGLQQDGFVTDVQLTGIITRVLKDKDARENWPKGAEWPPAHLLLHLARAVRMKEPAMAFKIPALRSDESAEKTSISIKKTIELLGGDTGTYFSNKYKTDAIQLLNTLLDEENSLTSLRLQLTRISALGPALRDYAMSIDASGARRFADDSPAYAHIIRTSFLLRRVLGCTYTKEKLNTLVQQITILGDLCQQRRDALKQHPLQVPSQTRNGRPDCGLTFYEQLCSNLRELVNTDPGYGSFLQAITVEEEERHDTDEIPLLSLLYTQFHRRTRPDRESSDNPNVRNSISGPSSIWDRTRQSLESALKELHALNEKQRKALEGVANFVNNPLCRSLSYTQEKVPPLPRFHLPDKTSYRIDNVEYELKGVVKHSNPSGEMGHYTALVPGFYCDDDKIESINESRFQQLATSGGDVILHLKKKKSG